MRRLVVLGSVAALAFVAFIGTGAFNTRAQEGDDAKVGVSALMGQDAGTPSAAAPGGIRLGRVHVAPGAEQTMPADGASLIIVSVESGTLTVSSTAPLTVNRAAGPEETTTSEAVAAGGEVTLGSGDAFINPRDAALTMRNDGEEPAVAMTASVPMALVAGMAPGVKTTPLGQGDTGLVMALAVVIPPHCPEGYAPPEAQPAGAPGAGGGGGGSGTVAVAIAEAPECAEGEAVEIVAVATPVP